MHINSRRFRIGGGQNSRMKMRLVALLAAIVSLHVFWGATATVEAASLTVDATCSLADAISAANDDAATGGCAAGNGADSISLSANVTLSGILPTITSEILIDGSGYSISGDDKYPGLVISGGDVTLQNITIKKAKINTFGGALYVYDGDLTLRSGVSIESNAAGDLGGGLYASESDVDISDTIFKSNETVRSHGGGIYFVSTTKNHKLDILKSEFNSNKAKEDGGAIKIAGGKVTIKKTTFHKNSADEGGAIESGDAMLTIENSTFSANTAREGGGLSSFGSKVTLTHTTWSLNSADEQGGAIAVIGWSGWLKMYNNLITDSASGGECHSGPNPNIITQFDGNFIRDGSCMTATPSPAVNAQSQSLRVAATPEAGQSAGESVDAALGDVAALQAPSTMTLTAQSDPDISDNLTGTPAMHRLEWSSLAIDAAATEHCLPDDQADTSRPRIQGCDIGAHELKQPTATPAMAQLPTNTAVPTSIDSDDDDDDNPPDRNPPTATPSGVNPPGGNPPGGNPPGSTPPGVNPPGGNPQGPQQPTPTPSPSPVPAPQGCVHNVVSGDNLFRLAIKYNTTVDQLRQVNQLLSDTLHIGQQLLVPAADCSPTPHICVVADEITVQSQQGYFQCLEVNTNRLDKHAALAPGMLAAVEIRGFVNPGTEVCFEGAGKIAHLDTVSSPPVVTTLTVYTSAGKHCAEIDAPGVVVLVAPDLSDSRARQIALTPLPSANTPRALANCQVTTTDPARIYAARAGDDAVGLVPYGVTLSATERAGDRFKVSFLGTDGWISSVGLQSQGSCD